MVYDTELKNRAFKLRKLGFSLQEISTKLQIAKSTVSLWVRGILLNESAIRKIEAKKVESRAKGTNTILKRSKEKQEVSRAEAIRALKLVNLNKETMKLLCARRYWAEGAKQTHTLVSFINS